MEAKSEATMKERKEAHGSSLVGRRGARKRITRAIG